MKLYAPKYYKDFHCIADRCRHSCCVGWEIDIDSETLEKYKKCTAPYGEVIRNSIEALDTPQFSLDENERCPHLNENGLCNIILSLGEDYLCHICRSHPRFYNFTPRGKEIGLGLVCEEACRIILSSDDYSEFVCVGQADGECEVFDFDPLAHRERLYSILSDRSLPYSQRLAKIYEEYDVSPNIHADSEWRGILGSLEYLDHGRAGLFTKYSSAVSASVKHEKILERALAYFIFRHCSEAYDENDLRASLGFCLVCERLIASLIAASVDINTILESARAVSEEIEYCEDNVGIITAEFLFNF